MSADIAIDLGNDCAANGAARWRSIRFPTSGNNYGFGFTQPTSEHYGQMRVDQTISSSDTFFTRYTIDQAAQTSVT